MPTHTPIRCRLAAASATALAVPLAGLALWLAACTSDEPGRTRTVEKTTVETPAAKTTTTETHEKTTTVHPPR
jgi:hypothetical protein